VTAAVTGPGDPNEAPSAVAVAEIPPTLLAVYRSAALTCPGLPWQVLAGIGWVESRHADGNADPASGAVTPPIVGPPLDGSANRALIRDATQPDGYAHALGPMQFLSTTWATWAAVAPDRPPGATPDIQNAWDAIYTAARFLCDGRDHLDDARGALLSYNHSEQYLADVLAKAREYGLGQSEPTSAEALVTGSGDAVVAAAMTQLGVPYVWGGESPGVGFDCSGLVQWAYAQIGVALPRTTFEQVNVGRTVSLADLHPGDLVFSRSLRAGEVVDLGHVAIYAGGGKVVLAPHTGDVVSLRSLDPTAVQAIRRIVG
jgi:cell wall-associated NlpC family hydrolase